MIDLVAWIAEKASKMTRVYKVPSQYSVFEKVAYRLGLLHAMDFFIAEAVAEGQSAKGTPEERLANIERIMKAAEELKQQEEWLRRMGWEQS